MACKKRWAEKAERWGNSKNQKEILEKKFQKNTIEGMKSAFEELIGRCDTAEERISKLENMSIETPKTEKQREKTTLKMEQNIQ